MLRAQGSRREVVNETLLRYAFTAAAAAAASYDDVALRIVDTEEPFAVACRLPEPTIVVSSALARRLRPEELRAVLEHERAHLVQRHHLVVGFAALNAACAPWLLAARRLERTTRLLIEVLADDAAITACGRPAVRAALLALAAVDDDPTLVMRARRTALVQPGGPRPIVARLARRVAGAA